MDSGYNLRSGCELFPVHQPELEIIGRTLEETKACPVSTAETHDALLKALKNAEKQGFAWRKDEIIAKADERLTTLVDRSRKAKSGD